MKDVILNRLEQTRLQVLNSVLAHQLPAAQAAEILGVSERHASRLLAAYRREGAAALAHGNRSRKPRNAVSDEEANTVVQLANLEPDPIVEDDDHVANSECETQAPEERPLSPRQLALWKAVQEAKVQDIPLREIARQLGISRNTVRKYARAHTQPTNRPHNRGVRRLPQLTTKR